MTPKQKAVVILEEAEIALRALVSESIASGDYETVVLLAAWARDISAILNPESKRAPAVPKTAGVPKLTPEALLRQTPDGYPRFFRTNDQLVRVSWSKREKKEYQHKAPKAVLQSLTTAMMAVGMEGRIFSTEQLLPVRDKDGHVCPSYQAYVVIALLKQTGLIDQHGRQGYSIPNPSKLKQNVNAVWAKLPQE